MRAGTCITPERATSIVATKSWRARYRGQQRGFQKTVEPGRDQCGATGQGRQLRQAQGASVIGLESQAGRPAEVRVNRALSAGDRRFPKDERSSREFDRLGELGGAQDGKSGPRRRFERQRRVGVTDNGVAQGDGRFPAEA